MTCKNCGHKIQIKRPGLMKRAANFGKALIGFASDRFRLVSPEVQAERQAICNKCAYRDPKDNVCNHGSCGCFLSAKTWIRKEQCPQNPPLWSALEYTKRTDLATVFDRAYVLNLDRRPDRYKRFLEGLPSDWPFCEVQRFSAIDGGKVQFPAYWSSGPGAWGCYRSHLAIIEQCLNDGVKSVLLLEDDALFPPDFTALAQVFFDFCPEDWGMVYLGGQHLRVGEHPPKQINPHVYLPYNVNRTHAFAIRGPMLNLIYQHLLRRDWTKGHHIDHHLGRLHQRRQHPIYCPSRWIVGQAGGKSNISNRIPPDRFWKAAESANPKVAKEVPFIAVVGLHSSGSSCLSGVLHHLGVYFGMKGQLGGMYGKEPDKNCGFEHQGLVNVCSRAIKFPQVQYKLSRWQIFQRLETWINNVKQQAMKKDKLAAGKYPTLCRMGDQLRNICGTGLRVIEAARPIDKSIRSMQRRFPNMDHEQIAKHQHWLEKGKQDLISEVKPQNFLSVQYDDMLSNPEAQIKRIVEFLKLDATRKEIDKAIAYVKPKLCHIR